MACRYPTHPISNFATRGKIIKVAGGLREQNIERRKQLILDGAMTIIMKDGLDALSMRGLAAEVGLAVATLYNLYGDRDTIVRAVLHQVFLELEEAIAPEEKITDPVERCVRTIKRITGYFIDKRIIITQIARGVTGRSVPFSEDHIDIKKRSASLLTPAISKVIEAGPLTGQVSADTLASIVYAIIESEAEDWSRGALDDAQFELKVQLGALIAIHAAVSKARRGAIEEEIGSIEKRIRSKAKRKARTA